MLSRHRPRRRIAAKSVALPAVLGTVMAFAAMACSDDGADSAGEGTASPSATTDMVAEPGTGSASAETAAAAPTEPDSTPSETAAAAPTGTDLTPTEAAASPAETASTPAETVVAPTDDGFWDPPQPLPDGEPGDVIWSRPTSTPAGEATLVLHLSSDLRGDPVAVSSMVYVPDGIDPSSPTPVLALAHGTTGIADECAQSRLAADGVAGDLALAPELLDQGWIVVTTDYEGLGTPGPHPYLVNRPAAQNVLDSVRAVTRLTGAGATASSPVVVFGFSQGGGAAAYVADIATSYAPELDVRGAVVAAPATEAGGFGSAELTPNRIAFGMMIVAGYLAAYPELDAGAYLTEIGQTQLDLVEDGCLNEVLNTISSADTAGWSNPPDSPGREEWQRVLDDNTPGRVAADVPVVVVHGSADETVLAEGTETYQLRACAAGSEVGRIVYPGASHVGVLTDTDAVDQSIEWLTAWLEGRDVDVGCPP